MASKIGQGNATAWAFLIISLTVIFCQIPVDKIMKHYNISKYGIIITGYISIIVMTIPLFFKQSLLTLLFFVLGIAISMILITPIFHILVSEFSNNESVASFFGFSSLSAAIGGSIGNVGGGLFIDLATKYNIPYLPWLCIIIINSLAVFGIYIYFIRQGKFAHSKKFIQEA